MRFLRRILLSVVPLLAVAGCANVNNPLEDVLPTSKGKEKETLKVTDVIFSDDYKTFTVDTRVVQSIGSVSLTNSDVVYDVRELDYLGRPSFQASQPDLIDVQRTGAAQVVALNMKMLVLVDLTLPQAMVDKERDAVAEMSTLFTNNNLFVAFISRKYETSGIMAPSKYVLENYFKSVDTEEKRLYNSVSRGLNLLSDQNGPFSDVSERVLLVLSDGKVLDDDGFAVDDNYFKVKTDLLDKSMRTDAHHLMYFVDIVGDLESAAEQHDAYPFLSTICRNTGGNIFDGFNWVRIENEIFKKLHIDYTDYRFVFENPDHKMYSGFGKTLVIDCYYNGEKVASGSTGIVMGSFFKPILVNPSSTDVMLARGIIFTMAILFIFYLICQLLIPAIQYRRFKKKYTGKYTDANMSISGVLVGDTCYYCKAPFAAGDEVVAKCEHTMHMDCWKENDHHCPEYGRNCRDGAHYYNSENRFDLRNAPYYLKWIAVAVLSGLLIWVLYITAYKGFDSRVIQSIAEKLNVSIEHIPLLLPSFAFIMIFILTMAFSFLSVRRRSHHVRCLGVLARSCTAGLCASLLFFLAMVADILLNLQSNSIIIDWIPWTLSGVVVALCSSYGTNFKINARSFFVVVVICVGTMFLWSFFSFRLSLDYRPYMVYTFEIFAIGIAIGLAHAEPRSERFFLHAGGAIKEMDIALYKWFASNPNTVVTIGKSIDCTLEMSWDSAPGIGPKKAEIRMDDGVLYLYALEDGVMVGNRELKAGKRIRLYRGRRFRIGNTEFEYQERDI